MRNNIIRVIRLAVSAALSIAAFAQDEPVIDPSLLKVKTASFDTLNAMRTLSAAALNSSSLASPALPLWQYSVVSPRDGNTYTGAIVGGNPFNRGARTTTVQVVVVPVRLALTGTPRNFDPTSTDNSCLGASNTALSLTQRSPLFTAAQNYTINGVNLGSATIPDAFQRAQFWSTVSSVSPAYHMALNISQAPVQTITTVNNPAGSAASFSFTNDCGTNAVAADNPPRYAAIDINFLDVQLNNIITNLGLTANQFPLFLLYRTFLTDGPPGNLSNNCCILGYHSTVTDAPANAPGQTYGIAGYYSPSNPFQPGTSDISVVSHEFMEWVNDPSGVNTTPRWGNIGQVGGCPTAKSGGQDNFETGDPLSGSLEQAIVMPNGVTYHPQEQAFFSWFFGGPSTAAGGKYSSNGSFAGSAKPCPPGGTN